MQLAGAAPGLKVSGEDKLPGTANYFVGNDASKWHADVPTYSKVKYAGVYPGVDLVYYGNQQQLEYDFVIAPGIDPKQVKLHFVGAKLSLNARGDLMVTSKNGKIAFEKPVVYQIKSGSSGEREQVNGNFTLMAANTVGFSLGSYDKSKTVVIDPNLAILSYSTYLGELALLRRLLQQHFNRRLRQRLRDRHRGVHQLPGDGRRVSKYKWRCRDWQL